MDLELYVHLYLPPQWDQGPKAASYDAYQDGSHVRLLLLEFIPPSFECVFSKYILLNGMHADAGLRPHVLQLADDSGTSLTHDAFRLARARYPSGHNLL